ncbi:hypothetical protein [uncultured Prevotella sp.]|uniref:leucine-rich repeat domain-containing protein n=1 Tax=uncultured Prevotella sp. TaxID=159272 RepID=UPI002599538E|nr:hypothetical protein [uncultured Prevotella sp.]
MKKYLLLLLVVALSFITAFAADESTITIKTSKPVGTTVSLDAYTASKDEAFTVDWGDGEEKIYNVDPNGWGYSRRIKTEIKGGTITIKGKLVNFDLTEAGITSVDIHGQTALKVINLKENEIATFKQDGMPALTELNLRDNKLTTFSGTGMTSLKTLNLQGNQLDSHEFDITDASATLTDLTVSNNGDKFITLNLMAFTALEYFYCDDNPEFTTAVFADNNANIKKISMNNCHVMHFYSCTFPNLYSLNLSNNALLDLEEGNYPKLSTLSIDHNYLTALDVTRFPKLESLYCGNNNITLLNVGNNPGLLSLNCDSLGITKLDISNNKDLAYLSVNGTKLTQLDIRGKRSITTLNISNTAIRYIDLEDQYSLRDFRARNTQCEFFYFNYINPWGRFNYVDIRDNKKMTGNSMNFTLHTIPQAYSDYSNSLLIAGSNGETADTEYATSQDMKWKCDVTGDGTAKNEAVKVTVDGTDTGERVSGKGEFGGITFEQEYDFTKYSTTGGTFTVSQWTGDYFQQLADVTTSAKAGVAIHITPTPAEGYVYDGVIVNGEKIQEEWFVVNGEATIKPVFRGADRKITFTAPAGQTLSFAVAVQKGADKKVQVDWGSGAKMEYDVSDTNYTRLDGTAETVAESGATESTVTIYGDVDALNLESFGEYGEMMGVWNNKVSSIDLTNNDLLIALNLYMNPIKTLDVTNQTGLQELDCSYCELTELDVTKNTKLLSLQCYGNELTTLDLSKLPELLELNARVNKLTGVDFTNNPKLQVVNVTNNELSTIDVAHLTDLVSLEAAGNKLTTLDVSKNTQLQVLGVGNNKLTELNLDNNTALRSLLFNDNSIQILDLSKLTELRQIDCGGNNMTACDLNQFYKDLPQYPELTKDEQEALKGASLTILTGTEETPNDAAGSDTSIASDKGWSVSMEGNGSGCDITWIYIGKTENGTIALKDAEGNDIQSGDKVKRNSPISLIATPDKGYVLDKVLVNGKAVEGTEFKISRISTVTATFDIASAIDAATINDASVTTANGSIIVSLPEGALAEVFSLDGTRICSLAAGTSIIPVADGTYIVRTKNGADLKTMKVSVK